MKKILLIFIAAVLILLTCSCSKDNGKAEETDDNYTKITLSQEDQAVLDAMKADIIVVTDYNYIDTVNSLNSSAKDKSGKVYQLEGTFTYQQIHDEKVPFIYRNYVQKNGETVEVGILINGMTVFPDEGDWIKLTGIMSTTEHDGHIHPTLDIVTVETPAEHGNMSIFE